MNETPKWAVEAGNEIYDYADEYENGERSIFSADSIAAIIAKHSPVEALVEALELALQTDTDRLSKLHPAGDYQVKDIISARISKYRTALALARGEK